MHDCVGSSQTNWQPRGLTADYELFGDSSRDRAWPDQVCASRCAGPRSTARSRPPESPFACVVPALGAKNIVYRDTKDRLHELSRDANGTTGTANLTELADALP